MPPVGEVEIVFTGLCSFLNLRNHNGTMPNPSVILPRTSAPFPHVPYIAFDKREVAVNDELSFQAVDSTNGNFLFRRLDGHEPINGQEPANCHELIIREDVPGWPNVLASYDLIANKDVYWPEARNKWNPKLVPVGNAAQSQLTDVAALLYFGGGTISAERMTDFAWEFRDEQGVPTTRGYYAQEVVYRIYPYRPPAPATIDELTITVRSLRPPGQEETYTFTSIRPDAHKIKLWIGNNDQGDIHRALLRLSSRPRQAVHFSYLNRIAVIDPVIDPVTGLPKVIGPVPMPLVPGGTFAPERGPGGSDTGYCGPHNAGG